MPSLPFNSALHDRSNLFICSTLTCPRRVCFTVERQLLEPTADSCKQANAGLAGDVCQGRARALPLRVKLIPRIKLLCRFKWKFAFKFMFGAKLMPRILVAFVGSCTARLKRHRLACQRRDAYEPSTEHDKCPLQGNVIVLLRATATGSRTCSASARARRSW